MRRNAADPSACQTRRWSTGTDLNGAPTCRWGRPRRPCSQEPSAVRCKSRLKESHHAEAAARCSRHVLSSPWPWRSPVRRRVPERQEKGQAGSDGRWNRARANVMLSLAKDQYKAGNFEQVPQDGRQRPEAGPEEPQPPHPLGQARDRAGPARAAERELKRPAALAPERRRGRLPERRRLPALAEAARWRTSSTRRVREGARRSWRTCWRRREMLVTSTARTRRWRCSRRRSITSRTAPPSATRAGSS